MSLIYDYLKINGKSYPERDLDVRVPPTLKSDLKRHIKSASSKHNSKIVLIILGTCVVLVLLIFLVVKIFTPENDMRVAVDSGSLPTIQAQPDIAPITPEPEVIVQQQAAPSPVPAAEPGFPATPSFGESKKVIQVFPEPGSPATVEVDVIQKTVDAATWQSGPIRKKIPQTLELGSRTQKITFPEETPVYTEVKQPAEKVTQPIPIHDDVLVQGAYQPSDSQENVVDVPSSVSRKSSIADNRFYSSSRPDSTALHKSKKFYQAGLQAQLRGDQRSAEVYYKKTLEEDKQHIEAMINLSALYVQQQRYDQAEDVLLDIFKVDPGNSKALVNMGVISLNKKDIVRAEEQFRAALDANPTEENALINLAYLAEKRGDLVSTERYYRQLLQISPDNIEVLLSYGHLLEEDGRFSEAVALYRDCLKLDSAKKDQQLYDRITQRMRFLSGAIRR